MDRLYSPWRLSYVTTSSEPVAGCIFCQAVSVDPGDPLIVARGRAAFVILNLYPYNSGHLMIVPNRHVASLAELSADERGDVMDLTARAEAAVTEVYRPQGLNIGVNLGKAAGAGIADHLHVHVVPRWTGDTNFMSVVGNVRVLPEEVPASVERLRPVFERLEGRGGVGA
jgi:ATP adenylyltransferase